MRNWNWVGIWRVNWLWVRKDAGGPIVSSGICHYVFFTRCLSIGCYFCRPSFPMTRKMAFHRPRLIPSYHTFNITKRKINFSPYFLYIIAVHFPPNFKWNCGRGQCCPFLSCCASPANSDSEWLFHNPACSK
jgi:hypothetical protein